MLTSLVPHSSMMGWVSEAVSIVKPRTLGDPLIVSSAVPIFHEINISLSHLTTFMIYIAMRWWFVLYFTFCVNSIGSAYSFVGCDFLPSFISVGIQWSFNTRLHTINSLTLSVCHAQNIGLVKQCQTMRNIPIPLLKIREINKLIYYTIDFIKCGIAQDPPFCKNSYLLFA